MRLFVFGCLMAAATVRAAPQQQPDKQELYRMLDDIRASIRLDDWNEAWRLAVRLNGSIIARLPTAGASPDLELQHLEFMAGTNAISRGPLLARLARTALAAGDLKKAERYANEALAASQHGVFWWTGDAIHQGNIVLGRLALRGGDLAEAKRYLLAAGKTPGSTSLGAQGPSMALAQELLGRGESAAVLQYLEECGSFWGGNRGKLAEWMALIRAGLKPDFGANVTY
jgi:ATP/maltotriose-dependent transcriptional regulator MalT